VEQRRLPRSLAAESPAARSPRRGNSLAGILKKTTFKRRTRNSVALEALEKDGDASREARRHSFSCGATGHFVMLPLDYAFQP
jgi:hypothetical protein